MKVFLLACIAVAVFILDPVECLTRISPTPEKCAGCATDPCKTTKITCKLGSAPSIDCQCRCVCKPLPTIFPPPPPPPPQPCLACRCRNCGINGRCFADLNKCTEGCDTQCRTPALCKRNPCSFNNKCQADEKCVAQCGSCTKTKCLKMTKPKNPCATKVCKPSERCKIDGCAATCVKKCLFNPCAATLCPKYHDAVPNLDTCTCRCRPCFRCQALCPLECKPTETCVQEPCGCKFNCVPKPTKPPVCKPCSKIACKKGSVCVANIFSCTARCEPVCRHCLKKNPNPCAKLNCGRKQYCAPTCFNCKAVCINLPSCRKNPCSRAQCKAGEKCISNFQTCTHTCRSCKTPCLAIFKPVCGSDGKTYSTECALNNAKCDNKYLRKKHDGPCKPVCSVNKCATIRCGFGARCVQDPKTCEAKCECPRFCPLVAKPVCGSDGKTYSNECFMNVESCKQQKLITKAHDGVCKPCPDRCATIRCGFFSTCVQDLKTCEAKCKCPDACPAIFAPVCGSDGVTYSNDCRRKVASCEQQKQITVAHPGACKTCPDKCATIRCKFFATCVQDKKTCKAECVCPEICPAVAAPVCGSDGVTYGNQCLLTVASCKQQKQITKASDGPCKPACVTCKDAKCKPEEECVDFTIGCGHRCECRPCRHIKCGAGETCVTNLSTCTGTCEKPCNKPCPEIFAPVCGSDGVQYDNECFFNNANCLAGGKLTFTDGECKKECPDNCKNKDCGPKPTLLGPSLRRCIMDPKTCEAKCVCSITCANILCIAGSRCIHDEKICNTTCVCSNKCPKIRRPVCGSNGVTYDNECLLNYASCKDNTIKKASDGECKINDVCPFHNPCAGVSCRKDQRCVPNFNKCAYSCQPRVCPNINCLQPACDGNNPCRSGETCINVCKGGCTAACLVSRSCEKLCTKEFNPVCGNDGRTYSNPCIFSIAVCKSDGRLTRIPCRVCPFRDPCKGIRCPGAQKCVANKKGCAYSCQPIRCPTETCLVPACFRGNGSCRKGTKCLAVCPSGCVQACEVTRDCKNLCNRNFPCARFGGKCFMNQRCRPQCNCQRRCTRERNPVCGSDGKTYSNPCVFQIAVCMSKGRLTRIPCRVCPFRNPCEGIRCPGGQKCVANKRGCAYSCQPIKCPTDTCLVPACFRGNGSCSKGTKCLAVCPNKCVQACEVTRDCKNKCTRNACKPGKRCSMNKRCQKECKCPSNCVCPFRGRCTRNSVTCKQTCTCTRGCPKIKKPVCGTDGKTYANQCLLDIEFCKTKGKTKRKHVGPCKKVCPDNCKGKCTGKNQKCVMNPLTCEAKCECSLTCANALCSTGRTCVDDFDNCNFQCVCPDNCKTVKCGAGQVCKIDDDTCRPKCECSGVCPDNYDPVCGSDGETYSNECELNFAICKSGGELKKKFDDSCENCMNQCARIDCTPERPNCVNKPETCSAECVKGKH